MKRTKERDLFSVKTNKKKRIGGKKKFNKENKVRSKKIKGKGGDDEIERFTIKHVPISYENIHVGQIILGSILYVFKYEIIVSLPNRMTGHLPVMHLSKSYNDLLYEISEGKPPSNKLYELEDLYSPGHLLATKVVSVVPYQNGTSKITLSALPQDVNCELTASLLSKHSVVQCAVVSEEENGFILETGVRNIRSAFLSKKYAPEGSFGVGNVLLCAVKKTIEDTDGSGDKSINVTAEPVYVNKEVNLSKKSNVASVFPGTLVSGTIKKIVSEGLELSFGDFRGFVRKDNLTTRETNIEDFKRGENVSARVLYVADLTSEIVCSMNAELCSESALASKIKCLSIDNIYYGIFMKESSEGAYFILPEGCYGLCSKRNLSHFKKDIKKKELLQGAEYKCRVTHIHMIDQVYNVTLDSNKNPDGALFHAGKCVSIKIAEHKEHGTLVVIRNTNKIGSIPKHHLTESNMSNPEEKCRVGCVFKARILKYFTGKDPVLTLKTELINSKLPIITEASEKFVGTISLGCVIKVYKSNLLVEFFNDSKALILGKDIPTHLRKNLNSYFQVGSIVKCKVTSYDDHEKKMFASLESKVTNDEEDTEELKNESILTHSILKVKDIVNAKIYAVNDDKIQVDIEGVDAKGCIPFYHLADDVEVSKSIFRLLNEGDEIKNAIVFRASKSDITLSLKPSFYHHLKAPSDQNCEKKVFPSVVKQCFEDKILVRILENKNKSDHIIPKDFIIKEKIDSVLNIGIQEGQTLVLSSFKSVKTKFCSHLDKVLSNSRTSGLQLLYDALLQETMVKNLCLQMKNLKLKEVVIGNCYEGKVIYVCNAGALIRLSELGIDGVIHPTNYNDSYLPKVNETLKVHVLNINYNNLCLELTVRKEKKFFRKKDHKLKVNQPAKCVILLAKKEYVIGRLLTLCPGQLIYLPSRRHINDINGRYNYYEVGKQYEVIIEHVDKEIVLANLKAHTEKTLLNIHKEIPSFNFISLYLRSFQNDLMLDETRYRYHDFKTRAISKIERVSNWLEIKKENNTETLNKFQILTEDKFSQFNEKLYWKNVLEKREERKKLRKKKLGPIKVQKRKLDESFDENNITEDGSDDDEINNDSTNLSKSDIVMKEHSNKRDMQINGKRNEKNQSKKRKLGENEHEDGKCANKNKHSNSKGEKGKEKIKRESSKTEESKDKKLKLEANQEDKDNKDNENKTDFLKIESSGFDWSGQILETQKDDDESSSDEEIEDAKEQKSVKRLSKYEKALKSKTEEKRTRQLELERLDDDREPETALDFEEKIERTPHSSAVWIEYISFHLENSETDKAKAVAARALATIPSTKEEDRLALWNVSLRLEVMYGTPQTILKSFEEALAKNDELKIYYIMIDIFLNANKAQEASLLIKKMVKKNSQNREVWIKAFYYYFKAKELTEARNMLDKSLLSLPKCDHVEVINRFAQLELKQGDFERGKTIFETLLGNHPKRLDIWNVYADLLVKHNDIQSARNVLERITGLKLKVAAMRNAFKKLLEFEKKHGSPKRIEVVKAMVEEYVKTALAEDA